MSAELLMQASWGAYGKIPALGDFLRIGLSPDFTRAWDTWLQSAMIAARDSLGDRWTGCYMSAPIWRFTLPGGLAGERAVLGVLMPSVDRVGRRFPLTLALPMEPAADAVATHLAASSAFETLEDTALAALGEDDTAAADLSARLRVLPVPEAVSPAERPAVLARSGLDAAAAAALEALPTGAGMTRGKSAISLWSCVLGDARRLMSAKGWPADEQITGLFDPEDRRWTADFSLWGAG